MSSEDNELTKRFQALRGVTQGTRFEMNSSVPGATYEQQQRLQQEKRSTKKKCRGNRKMQRYRRQLYTQGLDSKTMEELVETKLHALAQQQQQVDSEILEGYGTRNLKAYIPLDRISLPDISSGSSVDSIEMTPKRKRLLLTPTPTAETRTLLDQSLSQLSISQGHVKKKKTTTTSVQFDNNNDGLSIHSSEDYKPRYLKVSNRIFKQLLSNAIDNGHRIISCLDTNEKLHVVRQIAETTNSLYFKDLQRQLWQEYYNVSIKDDNWESTVTSGYAHQHNTCRMYKPRKPLIEQRQTKIARQIQEIANELRDSLMKLQECCEQWQPLIDFDVLSHAINECVKNGQRRLKDEFIYKKEMLTCSCKDHQLITKFYQLKPSDEQIELAKQIWQTTADELRTREQLEILRQRISIKRLPTKTDKMINQLLDDNQKTLSNPFLNRKQRASFASRCSKTIIQCKFNLMIIQMDEFETMIRQNHTTLTSSHDKISALNREKPHIYTNLLLETIEDRRQAMINRFIRMRQHKLKTFFDAAPAVDNSN